MTSTARTEARKRRQIRRRLFTAGLAAVAATAAVGTAALRSNAAPIGIATPPPNVVSTLAAHQFNVTSVTSVPTGIVSASSIEAGFQPSTFSGAYLVNMFDTSGTGWHCTCWLITYTPLTPDSSEGGLQANFYADFFDATSGNFITGLHGLF